MQALYFMKLMAIPYFIDHWILLALDTRKGGRHQIVIYDPGLEDCEKRADVTSRQVKKAVNLHHRGKRRIGV
jgi:hypothetical protein